MAAQRTGGPAAVTMASMIARGVPAASAVPPAALALADDIRDLVEAAVRTEVAPEVRERAAALVAEARALLEAETTDEVVRLVRHDNGVIEHLTSAGAGRLNPQAPRLVFRGLPPRPAEGAEPRTAEVVADCVLTAAHGGPPGRAHGGVVATLLDHVLGVAMSAAGRSGFTGSLDVRYRRATPYGEPLELRARWTGGEGRKNHVTGEILAGGEVTAEARAVFVTPADVAPERAADR